MLRLKFECMRVCLLLVSAVSQFAGQSRQMLVNYIEKYQSENGEMKFQCTMCGASFSQKPHAENHIENKHFPGCFKYDCKFCGTSFDRRNQLYKHVMNCPMKQ